MRIYYMRWFAPRNKRCKAVSTYSRYPARCWSWTEHSQILTVMFILELQPPLWIEDTQYRLQLALVSGTGIQTHKSFYAIDYYYI